MRKSHDKRTSFKLNPGKVLTTLTVLIFGLWKAYWASLSDALAIDELRIGTLSPQTAQFEASCNSPLIANKYIGHRPSDGRPKRTQAASGALLTRTTLIRGHLTDREIRDSDVILFHIYAS